ncbi:signal peptidase I [Pendulispora albinea]|uniref:Signal peptidase I n=1 Tax=Pendulispora albinea TaxID=2741071 RepID=A0ABZ2LTT2_9BACT
MSSSAHEQDDASNERQRGDEELGVAQARGSEGPSSEPPPPPSMGMGGRSVSPDDGPSSSRLLRSLYFGGWFVLVPLLLACLTIWALTPQSGLDHEGILGWIETGVREQPVPIGIALFAVFEMAIYAIRFRLPLSRHAHPPLREDIPEGLRTTFERARGLLDEAEVILARNEKAIARDLSLKERDKLRAELERLRDTMKATPFHEESFLEALVLADGEVDVRLGRWRKSEVREYVESILVAVAVAMALRAFVVEAFKIPSGSMIPTLMVGDHIFVNKFTYGPSIPWTHARVWKSLPPNRGDVMVFAFPEHPEQDFIKRVIALPGDRLEAKGGHPWINGWEVPHCLVGVYSYSEFDTPTGRREGDLFVEYLGDETYLTLYDHMGGSPDPQGPYFAKSGEVWVMGDNRNNSHDSRLWFGGQGGGVPYENIRGRALFVWFSVSDSGMAWSRLGATVMGRPRLPVHTPSLDAGLAKCLRERPAQTNPPPPGPMKGELQTRTGGREFDAP